MSNLSDKGEFINKLSYVLVGSIYWQMISRSINEWRTNYLEIPKKADRYGSTDLWKKQLHLLAYSPSVIPQPSDWPSNVTTTGYWRLSSTPCPVKKRIDDFLELSEERPVYIGFGSMIYENVENMASMVISALCRSKRRGIISFEERHLEGIFLPENIINVRAVPHDWLFPKMAAVIHHGGAGTTAAALTAGIPAIAIPFFSDQPFWGELIASIGVGLPPIKKEDLSTQKLLQVIEELTSNQNLATKARQLGSQLKKENGVGEAVRLIDDYVERSLK